MRTPAAEFRPWNQKYWQGDTDLLGWVSHGRGHASANLMNAFRIHFHPVLLVVSAAGILSISSGWPKPKLRRAGVHVMGATVSTHFLKGAEGELTTTDSIYELRKLNVLPEGSPEPYFCAFQGEQVGTSDGMKPFTTRGLDQKHASRLTFQTDAGIWVFGSRALLSGANSYASFPSPSLHEPGTALVHDEASPRQRYDIC